MDTIRVRILDPNLKGHWGDYHHISADKVDRGVREGRWKVEDERYPTKDMTAGKGGKSYETKEPKAEESKEEKKTKARAKALGKKDLYGEE